MLHQNLNDLAASIFEDNVTAGWWSDMNTGESIRATRDRGNLIALMHSEVSECWLGFKSNCKDDHLTDLPMAAVEMADTAIRILDLAGAEQFDIDKAVADIRFGQQPLSLSYGFATNLIDIHAHLSDALEGFRKDNREKACAALAAALLRIQLLADKWRYDLWAVVEAKRRYNRNRADHRLENRRLADGKRF